MTREEYHFKRRQEELRHSPANRHYKAHKPLSSSKMAFVLFVVVIVCILFGSIFGNDPVGIAFDTFWSYIFVVLFALVVAAGVLGLSYVFIYMICHYVLECYRNRSRGDSNRWTN